MPLEQQEMIKKEIEQFQTRTKQLLFQIQQLKDQIKDQARPKLDKLQENIDIQRVELQKQVDHLHNLRSKQETNKEINEQIKLNKTKQTTLKDEYYIVGDLAEDRKSTRLNSSHVASAYAVFCLKKKKRL